MKLIYMMMSLQKNISKGTRIHVGIFQVAKTIKGFKLQRTQNIN